jgi:hypothetical protein
MYIPNSIPNSIKIKICSSIGSPGGGGGGPCGSGSGGVCEKVVMIPKRYNITKIGLFATVFIYLRKSIFLFKKIIFC